MKAYSFSPDREIIELEVVHETEHTFIISQKNFHLLDPDIQEFIQDENDFELSKTLQTEVVLDLELAKRLQNSED